MKKLLSLILSFTVNHVGAQVLNPTPAISAAGAINGFTGGYTFSYTTTGSPWNGALISFGGYTNNYDCQISTDYGPAGGNRISFRTRNGDVSTWNSWYEIWHNGNLNNIKSDFTARNLFINNLVGIGTSSPQVPLHVATAHTAFGDFQMQEWDPTQSGYNLILSNYNGNSGIDYRFTQLNGNTSYPVLTFQAGNVGIGTTDPGSYKLAVKGGVHAQAVQIDMSGWSDYVFTPSYSLTPFAKLKNYIDQNGHLPDVPSEEQVKKQGIDLGGMNATLLKKIEELTLYLMEEHRDNQEQKSKIAFQSKQINTLKDQMKALLVRQKNK